MELADGGNAGGHVSLAMVQPFSSPQKLPHDRRTVPVASIAAGTGAAALLAGALALWAHYGTAVFFEMIVSGLQACF